ncbi:MAG: nucleoside permease [Planctomycetes bacterium]|nr:nucleoside permease [Planctomycetota bacterium]
MNLKPRLSFMMFLQYGIWGAWLPLLDPFLEGHRGFSLDQVGMIMAAGAVGAILGPFLAGQVADRWLATEKFLAFCHIIGAGLVWMLATTADYSSFLWLSLLYGLVYAPTLALTNSLAFHHLEDRDRDFGPIRLWGTIGWIAVGIGVGQWLLHMHTPADATAELIAAAQDAGRADAFKLSAILGVIMGLYCFTLPHTPPSKSPAKKNATFEALGEIRMQPLITLFLVSVPLSVIHQFYFVHTSQFLSVLQRSDAAAEGFANSINSVLGVGGGGLMTIGQMMEIPVLAIIPFIAKKVSRKSLLTFGLVAYAARMALFAYVGDSMAAVLLGVALHGLCFGCFIFVAFMVVDEQTTDDVRASAQNLYNLVIIGIGIIVGSWFAANIVGNWAMEGDVMNYTKLFSVPMWMALACVVFMLAFYPRGERKITLQ